MPSRKPIRHHKTIRNQLSSFLKFRLLFYPVPHACPSKKKKWNAETDEDWGGLRELFLFLRCASITIHHPSARRGWISINASEVCACVAILWGGVRIKSRYIYIYIYIPGKTVDGMGKSQWKRSDGRRDISAMLWVWVGYVARPDMNIRSASCSNFFLLYSYSYHYCLSIARSSGRAPPSGDSKTAPDRGTFSSNRLCWCAYIAYFDIVLCRYIRYYLLRIYIDIGLAIVWRTRRLIHISTVAWFVIWFGIYDFGMANA